MGPTVCSWNSDSRTGADGGRLGSQVGKRKEFSNFLRKVGTMENKEMGRNQEGDVCHEYVSHLS